MQGKKLVNLDNNLMLKSENIEYNNDTLKNTLDKIIESGSNETGEYIKYANGRLITMHEVTRNLERTKTWGNLYESNIQADLGNYPISFKDIPFVYITLHKTDAMPESVQQSTTSNAGKVHIMAPTAAEAADYVFHVLAIGRWK